MKTLTTGGVQVTVECNYLPDHSNPIQNYYVFNYLISIHNTTPYDIQLLRRHWNIYDSNGVYREIEGDGVIGFQPVIEPSQIHEYNSACHLETDIGKMNGYYTFQKLENGESFHVNIPEFKLICPYRSN